MRIRLPTIAWSLVPAALGGSLFGCGGSNQLVLGAYETSGTAAYVCSLSPGGGSAGCVPDSTSDETRWKKPGTIYIPFQAPLAQCDTGIQRILIENPRSGYTHILVECAHGH